MKIKICGITNVSDAEFAAIEGADYIGINFSLLSKRCVSINLGSEIAKAAFEHGTEPVAIFVDESLEDIIKICQSTNIKTLQLHGDASRSYFKYLINHFSIFYAQDVCADGLLAQSNCLNLQAAEAVLPLYDYFKAGSGKSFDWNIFTPPEKMRWILAGGLNAGNVCEAITLLKPYGVDVASGVENGNRTKDPVLVRKFIQNVRRLEGEL